jgi:DNA-binding HxlR family transcriptional regulator
MKKGNPKKPLDSASVCGREDPEAVRELLTKVGDKWSIFLILSLAKLPGGRARFSALERRSQASPKEC